MTENNTAPLENQKRNLLLEEFKVLVEVCRAYFDLFLKGLVLYFAVLGGSLKFFFDQQPNSLGRIVFLLFGICVNFVGILSTSVAGRHYLQLAKRCKEVCDLLDIPALYYPGTIAAAWVFLGIIITITISWFFLIFFL